MAYQTVFKRYELKYLMTAEQKQRVLASMEPYMIMDKYGDSTIRNIYFDTDDYILARHSILKPDFKEKLRIRSYSQADADSTVFVELKRKYDHVVYKRRVGLPEIAAMDWICGTGHNEPETDPQKGDEIRYFRNYYKDLRPAAFISYERQAYKLRKTEDIPPELRGNIGSDTGFRVTFDQNILFRDYDMSLRSEVYGERILPEGMTLMEIKCSGGIPLWMVKVLSEEYIYKTSFSKYGTAYTNKLFNNSATAEWQPAQAKELKEEQHAGQFTGKHLRYTTCYIN
ncbi:MAG: polyphosphate polymerase domain-containing protein [Mogibacterium sp.]|nr:polyphosphate polymerase domain-containing protein [Mogibacterium sp.]